MEQMTVKSIAEASAVKIITVVALFFLPATFTAVRRTLKNAMITSANKPPTGISGHGLLTYIGRFGWWISKTRCLCRCRSLAVLGADLTSNCGNSRRLVILGLVRFEEAQ